MRIAVLFLAGVSFAAPASEPVILAEDGRATLPIRVPEQADSAVIQLAGELSAHLGKITGARFAIERSADGPGILLGTAEDFPGLLPPADRPASLCRDDYLLRSEPGKLLVVGREFHGTRNAVWDLLHRIGFRQFFPGRNWEVWPHVPHLTMSVSVFESPAFYTRNLFLGGRTPAPRAEAFAEWKVRNRMDSGFTLNTTHAYGAIIKRNPRHFAEHPDDIAAGARPGTSKLDPSRDSALQVAVADSLVQLERKSSDSVSMDPSDGGSWRPDSPLGRPSNQAVTLANHVARSVQDRFPGAQVGMYAYHEHSAPPDIPVDPNVIVSIATAFLRDGETPASLAAGWRARGASIGIREYLSVWGWDRDKPGGSRATEIDYLRRAIPEFYELGARYWTSEASDGWGSQGFGYYLASRLLWDVNEAGRSAEIFDDFLNRSFGPSAPAVRRFFEGLLAEHRPLMSSDLLGRMYRALEEALTLADAPAIRARIFDLAIYTRSQELLLAWQNASGETREAARAALGEFLSRTRDSGMVNVGAILRSAGIEPGDERPLEESELHAMIARGITENALAGFAAVNFSNNLVPAAAAPESTPGGRLVVRDVNSLRLHAGAAPVAFHFTLRGGLIYGSRGPVKLRLFADQNPVPNDPVDVLEIPADKALRAITLKSPHAGPHRLEVSDGNDATEISWPAGQPAAWSASPGENPTLHGAYEAVFYVPEGATLLGGYSEVPAGVVESPDGVEQLDFGKSGGPGYFSVPVSAGQSGWWKFRNARGRKLLMTVPPWLARTADEALLPEEIMQTRKENE